MKRGTNEYEDESEIDQSSSFEGIYTDDFSEEEVGLYVLEIMPKVGALSDKKVRGDDNQSTPCVLTKGEVVERLNTIQLGPYLHPEERKQYEDLLCKYIHFFAFSYKDLRRSPWNNTKLNYYQMPNRSRPSKGGGTQDTWQW